MEASDSVVVTRDPVDEAVLGCVVVRFGRRCSNRE